MLTEVDPDLLLADFGSSVVAGAVSGLGILDRHSEMEIDGRIVSVDYSLIVRTDEFGGLQYGGLITVDGGSFKVQHEPLRIADGIYSVVVLESATRRVSTGEALAGAAVVAAGSALGGASTGGATVPGAAVVAAGTTQVAAGSALGGASTGEALAAGATVTASGSALGGSVSTYDQDANNYIQAVETADGQALENATRQAINNFVIGCKQDGIWTAIKASCILAGARTLAGALVPLAGTAPTNYNFVSGDYNRKTGLVGDGSTKYLDSNRASNAGSTNSYHVATYASTATTSIANQFPMYIGGGIGNSGTTHIGRLSSNGALFSRNRSSTSNANVSSGGDTGLIGSSRNNSSSYVFRASLVSISITQGSQTPPSDSVFIFNSSNGTSPVSNFYSNARIAFYSIGESLDLALLDARVTDLINAIGAAIP